MIDRPPPSSLPCGPPSLQALAAPPRATNRASGRPTQDAPSESRARSTGLAPPYVRTDVLLHAGSVTSIRAARSSKGSPSSVTPTASALATVNFSGSSRRAGSDVPAPEAPPTLVLPNEGVAVVAIGLKEFHAGRRDLPGARQVPPAAIQASSACPSASTVASFAMSQALLQRPSPDLHHFSSTARPCSSMRSTGPTRGQCASTLVRGAAARTCSIARCKSPLHGPPPTRLEPPGLSADLGINDHPRESWPEVSARQRPASVPVIGIAIARTLPIAVRRRNRGLNAVATRTSSVLGRHAELQHPRSLHRWWRHVTYEPRNSGSAIASGKGAASWAEPLRPHPRRARPASRSLSMAAPSVIDPNLLAGVADRTPLHHEREPVGPGALAASTVPVSAPRGRPAS
jgi:hypothetical protein